MGSDKSSIHSKNTGFIDKLLSVFSICHHCISRQIEINDSIRSKIQLISNKNNENCYICHGLLSRISTIVLSIKSKIEKYEFENWLMGIKLPTYMYENEDVVRSKFKIKGKDNIKTDFLKRLRNEIFLLLKKPIVFKRPDIVINLEILQDDSYDVLIQSKPLFVLGRYTKNISGIEQKNKNTKKDIESITNSYYDTNSSEDKIYVSIEQVIKEQLSSFYGDKKKEDITIFWIGSEDRESLVMGKGRPFIAQIFNPEKRSLSKTNIVFSNNKKLEKYHRRGKGICIFVDKILDKMPQSKICFLTTIRIYIECKQSISKNEIQKLNILKDKEITANYKSKKIIKKIYSIKSEYTDTNKFVLTIVSDGGLFIKQFIGDISSVMKPNVSEILGKTCTCLKFDILDIDLISGMV